MKDNLEYYPHFADSDNHEKFFVLRTEYGWAGEGMFWALNNAIARASGCKLDMSTKRAKAFFTSRFGMSFDELDKFIAYLVDDCELLLMDGDFITSEIVQEQYQKVSSERAKSRARKSGSGGKGKSSGGKGKSSGEPNNRVKESKEKKSKGEDSNAQEREPNLENFSTGNANAISNYIKSKMRKALSDKIPTGRYLPELADEIGRVAAGDGFEFNPNNRGSCKGLETWATTYVERLSEDEPEHVPNQEQFEQREDAYDRVIRIYREITGRLTSENQRKFLGPIIREHITKPGFTDDDLRTAFRQLRKAGEVFNDLDYTLKNISKLLKWANQAA